MFPSETKETNIMKHVPVRSAPQLAPEGLSRRSFLRRTAVAGAALAFPTIIPGSALGLNGTVAPSGRIVMGGIGIGGRGQYDLSVAIAESDVHFIAIADIREIRRKAVKEIADKKYGNSDCKMYMDFRELLARPDIDAVLIATGDRWHTTASIHAARAGKDMYCEKPCSMTIAESLALADTMRRYGRIYQAGTQRRSIANFIHAANLARSGRLGKLQTVHANTLAPATKHDWLPAEPEPPREEVDWNMWLGPCPWRPYNPRYVAGGWRGYFDFHGGGILEWGSHTVDLCQWANTADATTPVEFEPNPDGCVAKYANGVKLVMRSTGWMGLGTCSVRYEGTDGWVETGDSADIKTSSPDLMPDRGRKKQAGTDSDGHMRNFLDCVKSRVQPVANGEVAGNSHIACHAAYISWQLGRKLAYNPARGEFVGDEDANRMRSRAIRQPWVI